MAKHIELNNYVAFGTDSWLTILQQRSKNMKMNYNANPLS